MQVFISSKPGSDTILSLRFPLVKEWQYRYAPACHSAISGYTYQGPREVDSLSCFNCKAELLSAVDGTKLALRQTPSPNVGDIVGLWQCATESYAKILDPDTGELKIPPYTFLINENCIEIDSRKKIALGTD